MGRQPFRQWGIAIPVRGFGVDDTSNSEKPSNPGSRAASISADPGLRHRRMGIAKILSASVFFAPQVSSDLATLMHSNLLKARGL